MVRGEQEWTDVSEAGWSGVSPSTYMEPPPSEPFRLGPFCKTRDAAHMALNHASLKSAARKSPSRKAASVHLVFALEMCRGRGTLSQLPFQ